MTAMRTQDLDRPLGARPAAPSTRRAGSARRPVGAAGQARRTLERNLAAREASLRISRRASGSAGGVARQAPLPAAPEDAPTIAAPAAEPLLPPVARVAAAPVRPRPVAAAPALQPRPRPAARVAPVPAAQTVRPAARAQTHAAPRRAAAPLAMAAVQPAPMRMAAAAAVAMPAPRPVGLPQRRRQLVVLPGGGEQLRERLSVPAMIVGAVLALVVTVGIIVAVQIRVTQLNEQVGRDLSVTSQLQQSTVSQREQISSLVTSARIDDEAAKKQLIEPDPQDVRYLSAGEAEATGNRAAQVLRNLPAAAPSTTPAPTGSGTTTTPGATTP